MAVVSSLSGPGIAGPQGSPGTTSSGAFFAIALEAWLLNQSRIQLADCCVDSFITTQAVDPASSLHWNPTGYVETLTAASGISATINLNASASITSSGVVKELVLLPQQGPSAREDHAMAFSPQYNSLYLFGGFTSSGISNELWRFSFDQYRWSQIAYSNGPAARHQHTLVHNTLSGTLALVGGETASGIACDPWRYTISTNTWSSIPSLNAPGPRTGHSAVYDPLDNVMFCWGGLYYGTYYNELFQYRFLDNKWARIQDSISSNQPGTRAAQDMVYDSQRNRLTMQAGCSPTAFSSEIFTFDIDSTSWAQYQSGFPYVRGRHFSAVDPVSRQLIIGGGIDTNSFFLETFNVMNLDNAALASDPQPSLKLVGAKAVWNSNDNSMYAFGGRGSDGQLKSNLYRYRYIQYTTSTGIQTTTTSGKSFMTQGWTHLDSIKPMEQFSNLSRVYNAVSFDQQATWKIYTPAAKWSSIVQTVSGNWQYRTVSGTWTNAIPNTQSNALTTAFGIGSNQWYRTPATDRGVLGVSSVPCLALVQSPSCFVPNASSYYDTNHYPFKAFYNDASYGWLNSTSLGTSPQWIEVDCGDRPVGVYQYRWTPMEAATRGPKRFYLTGSNDYTSWTTLHATYSGADYPQQTMGSPSGWFTTSGNIGPWRFIRLTTISTWDGTYVDIKRLDLIDQQRDINSLSRTQWESTGGFIPGSTQQIDLAFGLKTNEHVPSVSAVTANYMTAVTPTNRLISTTWNLSKLNPTKAQFVVKCALPDPINLNVDLSAQISVDGGATYRQITLTQFQQAGAFTYLYGILTGIPAQNTNTVKTLIQLSGYQNTKIYGTAVAFDYT